MRGLHYSYQLHLLFGLNVPLGDKGIHRCDGFRTKVHDTFIGTSSRGRLIGVHFLEFQVAGNNAVKLMSSPCSDLGRYALFFAGVAEQVVELGHDSIFTFGRNFEFDVFLYHLFQRIDRLDQYMSPAPMRIANKHKGRLIDTVNDPVAGDGIHRSADTRD